MRFLAQLLADEHQFRFMITPILLSQQGAVACYGLAEGLPCGPVQAPHHTAWWLPSGCLPDQRAQVYNPCSGGATVAGETCSLPGGACRR